MSKPTYKIAFHKQATKELSSLDGLTRRRVADKVDALSVDPYPPDSSSLKGTANARRVRVGRYRVVYEVYADRIMVFVVGIAHRKQIYEIAKRRL